MARHPTPRTRRQRLLRRFVPLVVAAVVAGGLVATLLGGRSAPRTTTVPASSPVVRTTTTTPATPTTVPVTTTTSAAGSLPQTEGFPSATTPQFQAAMTELFGAIADGTPQAATGAFFPEAAYVQLKTIGDPAGDYQDRLLAEYDEDIAAATAELGTDAASATLVSVQVPMQYAHWVPPGVCDNSVGYFEVANSRMVYSLAGQTRSFGIASLISWRGEWYVVHLGAILRPQGGGQVLDPEAGPGTSAPSTTC